MEAVDYSNGLDCYIFSGNLIILLYKRLVYKRIRPPESTILRSLMLLSRTVVNANGFLLPKPIEWNSVVLDEDIVAG